MTQLYRLCANALHSYIEDGVTITVQFDHIIDEHVEHQIDTAVRWRTHVFSPAEIPDVLSSFTERLLGESFDRAYNR